MDHDPQDGFETDAAPRAYEPPQVERVMDAEELSLEVHYASFVPIS